MSVLNSCGNKQVEYKEIEYEESTQTILFDGKPFTGKVNGEGTHANEQAIVRNGKVVDIIKTVEKANGYKKITHKDNSCEYYDYNGNRISKSEYKNNN